MSDIKDFKSEWAPAPTVVPVPNGGTTLVRDSLTPTLGQQFYNTDTAQTEVWDGTAWVREVVPIPWKVISAAAQLTAGDAVMLVPTAAFSVTLPPTPTSGDSVTLADGSGTIATTNVTVLRNGSTIKGLAQDLVLNINDMRVDLVFTGTDWRVV